MVMNLEFILDGQIGYPLLVFVYRLVHMSILYKTS